MKKRICTLLAGVVMSVSILTGCSTNENEKETAAIQAETTEKDTAEAKGENKYPNKPIQMLLPARPG